MEKEVNLLLSKIDLYEFDEAEKMLKKRMNNKKFNDKLIVTIYDFQDFDSSVPLFFQHMIENNDEIKIKIYCHKFMSLFWFFSYNYIKGAAMNDLYHMKKILELDNSNKEMISYVKQLLEHPDYCEFIKKDLFLSHYLT